MLRESAHSLLSGPGNFACELPSSVRTLKPRRSQLVSEPQSFRERYNRPNGCKGRFLLFLLLALHPWIAAEAASQQPVQGGQDVNSLWIVQTSFDSEKLVLSAELENVSLMPITAYILRLDTYYSDGSRTVAFLTRDFSDSLVDASTDGVSGSPIHAGKRRPFQISAVRKKDSAIVDFTAVPVAVIFEDGTYEGESNAVDDVFRDREAKELAKVYWLNELRRARDRADSFESLKNLVAHMQTRLEGHTDSYFHGGVSSQNASARLEEQGIADNIKRLLAFDESDKFEQGLESLIFLLADELDNLQRHVKSPIDPRAFERELH